MPVKFPLRLMLWWVRDKLWNFPKGTQPHLIEMSVLTLITSTLHYNLACTSQVIDLLQSQEDSAKWSLPSPVRDNITQFSFYLQTSQNSLLLTRAVTPSPFQNSYKATGLRFKGKSTAGNALISTKWGSRGMLQSFFHGCFFSSMHTSSTELCNIVSMSLSCSRNR